MKTILSLLITLILPFSFTVAQTTAAFSFYGLSWGMSREEIMKMPDFAQPTSFGDSTLTFKPGVSDYLDNVYLTFARDNKLNDISCNFKYKEEKNGYKFFQNLFNKNYGTPTDQYKGYKDVVRYTWISDSSKIQLDGFNISFKNLKSEPGTDKKVVVVEDDFSDNKNKWEEENNEKCVTAITNGALSMSSKGDNGRFCSNSFIVDTTKDFTIECKMKHIDGANNYGYGLLWGHSDWDNSAEFLITGDGSYRILYSRHGDNGSRNWKEKRYTINSDKENTLKIKRKGNLLEYYINDDLVCFSGFRGLPGNRFGFIIYNKQTVQFDDFKITQTEMQSKTDEQPQFGNLTIYTNEKSLKEIPFTIKPILSVEERLKEISGKNSTDIVMGHSGKLGGTLDQCDECIPATDLFNDEGSSLLSKMIKARGTTAEGDYYYSISLPYGAYEISFYKFTSSQLYMRTATQTVSGSFVVQIDKPCTILPVSMKD